MKDERDRTPVTTVEEVMAFDLNEVVDGYQDGRHGEGEPGGNRSKAYWHGWRNGRADRTGKPDLAQQMLVKDYAKKGGLHPQLKKAPL